MSGVYSIWVSLCMAPRGATIGHDSFLERKEGCFDTDPTKPSTASRDGIPPALDDHRALTFHFQHPPYCLIECLIMSVIWYFRLKRIHVATYFSIHARFCNFPSPRGLVIWDDRIRKTQKRIKNRAIRFKGFLFDGNIHPIAFFIFMFPDQFLLSFSASSSTAKKLLRRSCDLFCVLFSIKHNGPVSGDSGNVFD